MIVYGQFTCVHVRSMIVYGQFTCVHVRSTIVYGQFTCVHVTMIVYGNSCVAVCSGQRGEPAVVPLVRRARGQEAGLSGRHHAWYGADGDGHRVFILPFSAAAAHAVCCCIECAYYFCILFGEHCSFGVVCSTDLT